MRDDDGKSLLACDEETCAVSYDLLLGRFKVGHGEAEECRVFFFMDGPRPGEGESWLLLASRLPLQHKHKIKLLSHEHIKQLATTT